MDRLKKIGVGLVFGGVAAIPAVHFAYAPLDLLVAERLRPEAVSVPMRKEASVDVPVRVSVPRLGIDAAVQPVGLSAGRAVGIPTRFADAAWFNLGPRPGEPGSAVMSGHYDNALGLPGAFHALPSVRPGDVVQVADARGEVRSFEVYAVARHPYDAGLSPEMLESGGRAELRLITCFGSWIQTEKTYSERLVVSARLIGV